MGDTFTDADLRLLPTVVRYDAVYNSLFRCTRRRIAADCPNLQAWMQDVWLMPCSGSMQVGGQLLWFFDGFARVMRTAVGHAVFLHLMSWLFVYRDPGRALIPEAGVGLMGELQHACYRISRHMAVFAFIRHLQGHPFHAVSVNFHVCSR